MKEYTKEEIDFAVNRIKTIDTSGRFNTCVNCPEYNNCRIMFSFFVMEFISKYENGPKPTTKEKIIMLIEKVIDTGCSSVDEIFENIDKCNKLLFSYTLHNIEGTKQKILAGKFDFIEENIDYLINIIRIHDEKLTMINSERVSGKKMSDIMLNFRMS